MNRFFIKKLSGIRPNVISNALLVLITLVCVFLLSPGKQVNAAESYTVELKDQAQTLSGKSVNSQFNFERPNYWQVKQATVTLNFQLTSLGLRQDSTLTLAINGIKVSSFRPQKTDQRQTKKVSLPVDLLEDNNVLQLSGQITTQGKAGSKNEQTPADWLTLYPGTTVNFHYTEDPPEQTLSSFFTRFVGTDKVAMHQSAVVLPDKADDETLSAALIALTARPQTAAIAAGRIGLKTFSIVDQQDKYRVMVARYDQLPFALKKVIPKARLTDQGLLQAVYSQGHFNLVVTARSNKMLRKAAAYFANHELMLQTNKSFQQVSAMTDTSHSQKRPLEQQLTTTEQTFSGSGEQQKLFAFSLPAGQTQNLGSQIKLHFQYSAKLDFKKAKIKVYVNDQLAGQKKLTRKKVQGDSLVIKLPQRATIQNGYLIKVAFVLAGQNKQQKEQTVWAKLEPDSVAQIKQQPINTLLFDNFFGAFMPDQTLNSLAVVRPRELTSDDLAALSDLFALLGQKAQGAEKLRVYSDPSRKDLKAKNIIALGTPRQNKLIKKLNSRLYFKFAPGYRYFESNEKMSLEKDWSQQLGIAQLLRSPYNSNQALLVVTAASPRYLEQAAQQFATEKSLQALNGKDAVVVAQDQGISSFRFIKDPALNQHLQQRLKQQENQQLYWYFGILTGAIVLLVLAAWLLVVHKNRVAGGSQK